ncbi:hypothetical protein Psuf_044710 [Phytohabitans suffuscus]|uniref:Peptidase S8/S53 domain-containing protein n=1 Tax=Phytohabitans suffuscus TaxID=624315 RepID=A0A6F8YMG4_9ACTN|nr:S8 family serine peptidase [Phytohabitans suffuscus]BCB87158.1 hypothetical protein Psuf_044710 [Phytohabitans suffuscus]
MLDPINALTGDPGTALDTTGDVIGPLDGMRDPLAGHGTFICGLVRQTCPDADILPVQVIHSDGVIVESELLAALQTLRELARKFAAGEAGGQAIDIISLSLGFYHESAEDDAYMSLLYEEIRNLAELGVAVVAAAGNDATARPMFPAAYALQPEGVEAPVVPVSSVGALNPNGSIALFSNTGAWVSHWEPGAAVVSTMPKFDHAMAPGAAVMDPFHGRSRENIDPDDFGGGFAISSGTSFAAPILAGRIARALIAENGVGSLMTTESDPVKRMERAIEAAQPQP